MKEITNEEKESQDVYTGSNIRVSTVKDAVSTATRDCDAEEIIKSIREGKHRGVIEHIRKTYQDVMIQTTGDRIAAKKAVGTAKKKLPGVLWSGRFSHRKDKDLTCHSGLLCADLDSLGDALAELRLKLLTSPHLWAMFLSPTGDGLKCVFRVKPDAQTHLASFRAVAHHVRELTGVEVDKSCSNVSRLCFVSDDREAFLNVEAKELEGLTEATKEAATVSTVSAAAPRCHSGNLRQKIAQELLGEIEWTSDTVGYCDCPARHLHTSIDGERDCEVYLDGTPTIHCFHNSCDGIRNGANHELRSRIGKAERTIVSSQINRPVAESINNSEDAIIATLAQLPIVEYERRRKREAEHLGVRGSILDKLVAAKRGNKDDLQGSAVLLQPVELWPCAVDGSGILSEIAAVFRKYIVLAEEQADALALWCAHSHAFRAFTCSPRLNIWAPDKGCGKTILRDVVSLFVPKPLTADDLTPAVLFRVVAAESPTILADEYDRWIEKNDELCSLLNVSHRYNGRACRCEGDGNTVRAFPCFAPVVLCGIGALPDTLQDRSIQIRLERAKRTERYTRFEPKHVELEQELCRKLARWCADNFGQLESTDPKMPDAAYNRIADNWRPLFAIAELAGSDWVQCCHLAFNKLTSRDDEESLSIMLLSDIRFILTNHADERMFSKDLVEFLCKMEDRPWVTMYRGHGITSNWLARQLGRFDIHPKTLRIGKDERFKGYETADFKDAFERYLPSEGYMSRDNVTSPENGTFPTVTTVSYVTDGESLQSPDNEDLSRRHASTPVAGANGDDLLEEGAEETVTVNEESLL